MRIATAFLAAAALAGPPSADAARAECPKQPFDRPSAGAAEAPQARARRAELEMVVNVLASYRSCEDDVPGFAGRFGPDYRDWRRKYAGAIRRYEGDPRARRYVECGLEEERKRAASSDADGRMQKAQLCNSVVGPGIRQVTKDGPRR